MQPALDHPRRCGENHGGGRHSDDRRGSPPQMRGKHNATHQSIADNRITPADAGKTFWVFGVLNPRQGSPPQMRGKPDAKSPFLLQQGITPADAGKTYRSRRRDYAAADHPRRCGENEPVSEVELQDLGSPPQMRGKHCICAATSTQQRITPADAGKTSMDSTLISPM